MTLEIRLYVCFIFVIAHKFYEVTWQDDMLCYLSLLQG